MDTSNISIVHNISTDKKKACASVVQQNEDSPVDNHCHIDTFIQQVLAYAPESERKIWARIKNELDI